VLANSVYLGSVETKVRANMDRAYFYKMMEGQGTLDYQRYLNTTALFQCQKPYHDLCTHDELMFQLVHQVEELWMKLVGFTLLDIDDYLTKMHSQRVVTLLQRACRTLELMRNSLNILETMSPHEYQSIRLQLGNGSGQESPGFRTLLEMPKALWTTYEQAYLIAQNRTLEAIYDQEYAHDEAYVIAEGLAEYDERFRAFRFQHIQLIERSIGLESKSLKGREVKRLLSGCTERLFPQLWDIRSQMTNRWGRIYGEKRDSLGKDVNQS
jgi:tryptophan 2,3-dioxygenase